MARENNRFSALRSLVAENDTEVEDELARGKPGVYIVLSSKYQDANLRRRLQK